MNGANSAGRTLLVAHPSADRYGADRVMLESVRAMTDAGWRVVVTVPSDGPLEANLSLAGAEVVHCPAPVLRKSALRPAGLLKLVAQTVVSLPQQVRLIRKTRAAVVYVSTQTVPSWSLLAKLLRRRVVIHIHEAERSAPAAVKAILALPALTADLLIVNSEFTGRVLAESLPGRVGQRIAGRSVTVLNPISAGPQLSSPSGERSCPVELLFVGRLSPRKGPDVAISALELLRHEGLDARLTLLGSVFTGYEWYEAALRAQASAAELDDEVIFGGFQDDVSGFRAAADIVLVPSVLDEPFGNVAVEALLAQRPVIVTQTSGLIEATAGFGAVVGVPPSQPQAIADAVRTIVDNWTWYAGAATADRKTALARHSPDRYRQEVSRLVSSLGEC